MKPLTYEDYSDYYASKCDKCLGLKRISSNNSWITCGCQFTSTVKWRYDQIQITPDELKYKNWPDFVGVITNGENTVGRLTEKSLINAKCGAIQYCFGSSDPSVISDRKKNLIIHKHLLDGQNVVISGDKRTGKTLLAALILKEVVYASVIHGLKLGFKWIKSSQILNAAKWDNIKGIDHDIIDEIKDVEFLVIDGLETLVGGHNSPPDLSTLNEMFYTRSINKHPTIFVCSNDFWKESNNKRYQENITRMWGDEFINVFTHSNNVLLRLCKEDMNVTAE